MRNIIDVQCRAQLPCPLFRVFFNWGHQNSILLLLSRVAEYVTNEFKLHTLNCTSVILGLLLILDACL